MISWSTWFFLLCAEERYGRESKVISVDFSGGQEIYTELANKLLGLDIGILGKGILN